MALGRKPIEIVNEGKHQLLAKAEHWERIYLKEVAKVQNGFAFSSDHFTKGKGIPLIRIRDIDNITTVDNYNGPYNGDFIVKKGDILIGMDGDFYASRWKGEHALLNQRVCRIIHTSNHYNEKFLFLCLQPFLDAIHAETSAVTVKHISSETIKELPLPCPPLQEQIAIVAKIEELFSELDKGVENLKLAQQQLKTYRQSVLKWAFEGKLTNDNVKEGELPKGWKEVTIEDVSKVGTGATPLKGNANYYKNGSIAWVTSGALNDEFVREATDYVTPLALKETNLSIYPKHTLLLAMYGEGKTRGKCSELLIDATTNQAIAAISFEKHDMRVKPFLKYFLLKNYNDIRRLSSGGVQPNLNLGIVKKTLFPFPPIEEQHLIVQEIESRLSVADKLEESITQSLQQVEALRQSILKQAFEGKLIVEKKQEIVKPKNVYFHQLQVLGWIAQTSKQKNISHGEMTTAKYAYLVDKVYGVPTYYDFKRGHLGPYPIEMKKAINNKEYFKIAKTIEVVNEEKLFKYNNPYKNQVINAVEDLATIFDRYEGKERAHKTELLATVCKVVEDIKSIDLSLVYQSMREWPIDLKTTPCKNKAEKFTEEETQKCLVFVVARGWDKKLI